MGKKLKEHINMRVKGEKFAPAFSYSDNDLVTGKDNDIFADDVKWIDIDVCVKE